MKNHLKSRHSTEFQALIKGTGTPTKPPLPLPGTSSYEGLITVPYTYNPTQELPENKMLLDANYSKAERCHYLIAEMIALDNEPLSIVEKTGFTRLLEQIIPFYKMPSPTYLSETIVPDIYNRIFEKIKRNISHSLAISVTSDVWSCLHNNSSFLIFTAHWLSSEFKLEHAVLSTVPFSKSPTEENIVKKLNTIADRWDFDHNKIHLLVKNTGNNAVSDVRLAEYCSAICFIHSLQIAIHESLKTQPEVTTMIDTSRQLVTHFKNSIFQEKLQGIQKELNQPYVQIVQDNSTRWNSTFYMIQRLLDQKRAISLYAAGHDTLINLPPQQWNLMEQYIRLLQPFAEVTKITSAGLSCISEVIPYVSALKKYLDKNETEHGTPDLYLMRESLKSELESRLNFLSQDYNYLISTFLDPRFKADFLGAVEAERARQKIQLEFIKMSCDESSVSSDFSTPVKKIKLENSELSENDDVQESFWACFDEVANESICSQSHDEKRNAIICEIDYYLKKIRIDRNYDPYTWWSANALQYPNLTKFARIYLSAPCSSVYSERLYSEAGLEYEDKRNRLLSVNEEKLVFIHHNLPLIQYEY